MRISRILKPVALFLLAIPTFASDLASYLTCDVKLNQENQFKFLENGKVATDLSNGTLKVQTDSKIINLISDTTVGTMKADKSTCILTSSVDYEGDGSLKGYKFYFEDCTTPDGGNVTVTNSYTVKTNRGVYQEATFVNGNYLFNYFFIENCNNK